MGGAKNCPETPRQRMISMMYLVLTAMLALNVSADILNGFTKLRHSMESSMNSTEVRTDAVLESFKIQALDNEGYQDWLDIANAIAAKSDEFYNYIENFKLDIANMCDNKHFEAEALDTIKLKNGSDTNKPHQYALTEYDTETGRLHAEEMKYRMDEFRFYMTTAESKIILDKIEKDANFKEEWERKTSMFNALFSTADVVDEEGATISWERSTFAEMPADAVIALLTKYQNDIRVAENDMINYFFSLAGSSDFVVNQATAVVIPTNGEYIMQGKQYRAKIVAAMMDTNQVPRVFIGGQEIEGGEYITQGHIGENVYDGYMIIGDDTTKYPFRGQFTVGAPAATIANTECNVLYRGYGNKMSISVPGVGAEAISATCNGASIQKVGKGEWIITPSSSQPVTISVSAMIEGHSSPMGTQTFQVKNLPRPIAYLSIGGKIVTASVPVPLGSLAACSIQADNADAVIKVDWKVKPGYRVKCRRKNVNSLAQAATIAKSGDIIKVTDIHAVGPGGQEVILNDLAIEVQ